MTPVAMTEPRCHRAYVGDDDDWHIRGFLREVLLAAKLHRAVRLTAACVAWLGATVAYVGSYAEPAHSLYASAGMQTVERLVPRTRRWPAM
jgi:hypothetical protein